MTRGETESQAGSLRLVGQPTVLERGAFALTRHQWFISSATSKDVDPPDDVGVPLFDQPPGFVPMAE